MAVQSEKKAANKKKIILTSGIILVIAVIILTVCYFRGEGTEGKIQGFTPFDEENLNQGLVLNQEGLALKAIGIYSGAYMEDGTDEAVENVAAVLVKNESDQMLQIAELELTFENGDTAQFRLTNLPAGGTVLALDMNRLTCDADSRAREISEAVHFFDKVPMETDKFDTAGAEGRLTLKNKSDETYPLVYVYYKTKADSDIYLGGITYRVPFEQIQGKTQIDSDAAHYSPDKSEIVEIQILSEDVVNNKNEEKEEE